MLRRLGLLVLALGSMHLAPASAFAGGMICVPCCGATCCPPPHPPAPWFSLHAHLTNPSGFIRPNAAIPFTIVVTNHSHHALVYGRSEYRFYVLDAHGHHIPVALTVQPPLTGTVTVNPHTSSIDSPAGVIANLPPLILGHHYTFIVRLRGHKACFRFVPMLDAMKPAPTDNPAPGVLTRSEKAVSTAVANRIPSTRPATIIATVPADATLTFNGVSTRSTSGKRVFLTPDLEEGQSYYYNVKATVTRDGRAQTVTERVRVRAGEKVQLDLQLPQAAIAAR